MRSKQVAAATEISILDSQHSCEFDEWMRDSSVFASWRRLLRRHTCSLLNRLQANKVRWLISYLGENKFKNIHTCWMLLSPLPLTAKFFPIQCLRAVRVAGSLKGRQSGPSWWVFFFSSFCSRFVEWNAMQIAHLSDKFSVLQCFSSFSFQKLKCHENIKPQAVWLVRWTLLILFWVQAIGLMFGLYFHCGINRPFVSKKNFKNLNPLFIDFSRNFGIFWRNSVVKN